MLLTSADVGDGCHIFPRWHARLLDGGRIRRESMPLLPPSLWVVRSANFTWLTRELLRWWHAWNDELILSKS